MGVRHIGFVNSARMYKLSSSYMKCACDEEKKRIEGKMGELSGKMVRTGFVRCGVARKDFPAYSKTMEAASGNVLNAVLAKSAPAAAEDDAGRMARLLAKPFKVAISVFNWAAPALALLFNSGIVQVEGWLAKASLVAVGVSLPIRAVLFSSKFTSFTNDLQYAIHGAVRENSPELLELKTHALVNFFRGACAAASDAADGLKAAVFGDPKKSGSPASSKPLSDTPGQF